MGIYSGSVNITKYRIVGQSKSYKLATLNPCLEGHRAAPLRLTGIAKEETSGWVKPQIAMEFNEDLEDGDHWDLSDCFFEDGFFLRQRVERRKVPSQLLQLLYRQKIGEAAGKDGKGLPRNEKKLIKEKLQRELLQKCLPQISYVDGFWREPSQELLVFSTSKLQLDGFQKLFSQTFLEPLSLSMIMLTPALLGLAVEDWEDDDKAVAVLDKVAMALPAVMDRTPEVVY